MDERPWFKSYDPGVPRTLQPYPERTLMDVMADTVRERPGHTAMIFKGDRMTYAEMERLTQCASPRRSSSWGCRRASVWRW